MSLARVTSKFYGVWLLLLGVLASGCPGNGLTETDRDGNAISWTVTATIDGGYPSGVAAFSQVASDGSVVSDPIPDATGGATYEYSGEATSYPLRIMNRQGCLAPCGFVQLLICPKSNPHCTSGAALKDLGMQEVKTFAVQF